MGDALQRPVEELAGQPLAGALILSDGGNNLGEDPIMAADAAKQAGLRVSTIGVGDPTKTKDVALLSVLADDTVRVNNTVTVYVALSQRGYAGKTIGVTLRRGNEIVGHEIGAPRPGRSEAGSAFQLCAHRRAVASPTRSRPMCCRAN